MGTIQGIACLLLVLLSIALKPGSKNFENLLPENQQLVQLVRENKSTFIVLAIVCIITGTILCRGLMYCISLFFL